MGCKRNLSPPSAALDMNKDDNELACRLALSSELLPPRFPSRQRVVRRDATRPTMGTDWLLCATSWSLHLAWSLLAHSLLRLLARSRLASGHSLSLQPPSAQLEHPPPDSRHSTPRVALSEPSAPLDLHQESSPRTPAAPLSLSVLSVPTSRSRRSPLTPESSRSHARTHAHATRQVCTP